QPVDQRGLSDIGIADDRNLHLQLRLVSRSGSLISFHQRNHPGHNLLEAQTGGVKHNRSGGRLERRVLALGVSPVADRLLREHGLWISAELGSSALRSFLRRGG